MTLTACSILAALTLTTGSAADDPSRTTAPAPETSASRSLETPVAADAQVPGVVFRTPARVQRWMTDTPEKRPAALPALYAAYGAIQAFDVYSTRRAIANSATEANPLMKPIVGSSTAMLAVKAASTAATIFFTERAWKKSRKGAIILMAAVNGVTAGMSARNMKNAK